MREIITMARYEYLRHVRRRGFVVTALVMPLVLVALFVVIGLVASNSRAETSLGFVDQTGRFANIDLTQIDGEPVDIPMTRFANEGEGLAAVEAGQVSAVVVVPPAYNHDGTVRVLGPKALGDSARDQVRDILRQALVTAVPGETQARFAEPVDLRLRTLGSNREVDSSNILLFMLPYVIAVLFLITTFTTSGYLLQALADEKEDRVMEILATTLRPSQMMAGKIIGLSGVGLTQMTAWVAWAVAGLLAIPVARRFLSELQLPWGILMLSLAFFLLGYLLVAAIYAAIGAAVTNPQEGQQFAAPVSLLVVSPLWLVVVILAQPNSTLAVILSLIPLTAPITMLLRLPLTSIPAWQLLLSLTLLALSAIGMMFLAARVMRIGMLRYGKRLSLKELVRA